MIGFSELLVLALIVSLFLGPDRLPQAARTVTRTLASWRSELQGASAKLGEDLHIRELKEELDAVRSELDAIRAVPEELVGLAAGVSPLDVVEAAATAADARTGPDDPSAPHPGREEPGDPPAGPAPDSEHTDLFADDVVGPDIGPAPFAAGPAPDPEHTDLFADDVVGPDIGPAPFAAGPDVDLFADGPDTGPGLFVDEPSEAVGRWVDPSDLAAEVGVDLQALIDELDDAPAPPLPDLAAATVDRLLERGMSPGDDPAATGPVTDAAEPTPRPGTAFTDLVDEPEPPAAPPSPPAAGSPWTRVPLQALLAPTDPDTPA